MQYFSFGKYLELHQRVEYLENELDKKTIVRKRNTIVPVVSGEHGGFLMRFDSEYNNNSQLTKWPSRIDTSPNKLEDLKEEEED